MRLPFLILTPACVFLGLSVVIANQIKVDMYLLALTLLAAVLAHISVNTLNEYSDFKTGLDFKTKRTQFSGGSGALPQNPEMAMTVLSVGVVSLLSTLIIGIFFFWMLGPGVIPIGVAGLLLVVAYTPWITKRPYLCLIGPNAPGAFRPELTQAPQDENGISWGISMIHNGDEAYLIRYDCESE